MRPDRPVHGRASGSLKQVSDWVETIGHHIKSVIPVTSISTPSGIFRSYPAVLDNKTPDLVTFEYYPHWDTLLGTSQVHTTAATFTEDAATITGHGKVYIVNEFGWDRTDWKSQADLQEGSRYAGERSERFG